MITKTGRVLIHEDEIREHYEKILKRKNETITELQKEIQMQENQLENIKKKVEKINKKLQTATNEGYLDFLYTYGEEIK